MPVLSGTLRYWSGDATPAQVRLERVDFAYHDTWEPSLIVEDRYVAQVDGRRVRFSEYDGIAEGLSVKVEGAEHAALSDWVRHVAGSEATIAGPDFVDSIVLTMRKF